MDSTPHLNLSPAAEAPLRHSTAAAIVVAAASLYLACFSTPPAAATAAASAGFVVPSTPRSTTSTETSTNPPRHRAAAFLPMTSASSTPPSSSSSSSPWGSYRKSRRRRVRVSSTTSTSIEITESKWNNTNDQGRDDSIHLKSEEGEASSQPPPLFSVGVIADIQYAPVPDGHSFSGQPRYYRHALSTARVAAEHFQSDSVSLVINLGDIIDGKCTTDEMSEKSGAESLVDVVDALSVYDRGRVLHAYGNHELYNLDREDLADALGIPFVAEEPHGELVGYHSHLHTHDGDDDGVNNVRFVVLDTYDISLMGRCPKNSVKRRKAEELLGRHNPNFPHEENSPVGLEGDGKRFVAFNGGVDTTQLNWLRDTLETSRDRGEKVILLSHQPIHPGSSNPVCLVWNYDEVLSVLREYGCTVVASFAGHAHRGGYRRDEVSGIHFRVFEAALESPDPTKTYGFVDVYGDRLVVRGVGDCESATYDFDHIEVNAAAASRRSRRARAMADGASSERSPSDASD